jgi:hypothetical protein
LNAILNLTSPRESEAQEILNAEQEAFDAVPESSQDSDAGVGALEIINNLQMSGAF